MTSPKSSPVEAAPRVDPPRSDGSSGTAPALEPEVWLVVERAAALPRGLALLHRAPLESAAVLLAAHPDRVARARAALDGGATRAAVLGHFAQAAGRGGGAPVEPPRAPPGPRSPHELLRAAREQPERIAVLASASVEYAAIAFGAHPALVLAARELIAGGGGLPGNGAEGA